MLSQSNSSPNNHNVPRSHGLQVKTKENQNPYYPKNVNRLHLEFATTYQESSQLKMFQY